MTGRWSKPRRPPGAQSCSLVSTRYAVLIALAQCRPASVMGNSHCGNILDSAWATIHDGSGDICSAHPFLFPVSLSQVRGWWLQLRMACRRLSASRRGARDAQGGRLAQLGVGAAAAVQIVRVLRSGGAEARAGRTLAGRTLAGCTLAGRTFTRTLTRMLAMPHAMRTRMPFTCLPRTHSRAAFAMRTLGARKLGARTLIALVASRRTHARRMARRTPTYCYVRIIY